MLMRSGSRKGRGRNLLNYLRYRVTKWWKGQPSFSRKELIYLSGVIDADGSFSKKSSSLYPISFVTQNNKLYEWLSGVTGVKNSETRQYQTCYWLRFSRSMVHELLPLLVPYLIARKEDALRIMAEK